MLTAPGLIFRQSNTAPNRTASPLPTIPPITTSTSPAPSSLHAGRREYPTQPTSSRSLPGHTAESRPPLDWTLILKLCKMAWRHMTQRERGLCYLHVAVVLCINTVYQGSCRRKLARVQGLGKVQGQAHFQLWLKDWLFANLTQPQWHHLAFAEPDTHRIPASYGTC